METSPAIKKPRHWYFIAWVSAFGVIVFGSIPQGNFAGGAYDIWFYSICGISLLLAIYSVIRYKFGSLTDLLLFLPIGGSDE